MEMGGGSAGPGWDAGGRRRPPRPTADFPEAAALSFGIIGLRIDRWRASPARIALALPAAAVLGVGLAHVAGPVIVLEIAALTAVLAGLRLVGSALTPTISAAMLPLVFGLRDWTFVAAVAAIAAVLAVAAGRQTRPAGPATNVMPTGPVLAGWAIAVGWVILAGRSLVFRRLRWPAADRGYFRVAGPP